VIDRPAMDLRSDAIQTHSMLEPAFVATRTIELSAITKSNHPAHPYEAMLADAPRMQAYRRAIEAVVRPGDVVADLGTGSGVLALMAAQAGAGRVYAIDRRPRSLWIAERIIRANGAEETIELIEADVREIVLAQPVDLIVNELIGDFGTDEDIFDAVARFARANLSPDGRIIPEQLQTYLVPVEYRGEFRGVWNRSIHGLDLRAGNDLPSKPEAELHALRAKPIELAAPKLIEDIHFGPNMGERCDVYDVEFEITSAGTLQGFAGYFDATLTAGIHLSNYPCYPTCHWRNWHWPVCPAIEALPGQLIRARLDAKAGYPAVAWTLDWSASGAT
jgi:SAM-dependent methyltransferase